MCALKLNLIAVMMKRGKAKGMSGKFVIQRSASEIDTISRIFIAILVLTISKKVRVSHHLRLGSLCMRMLLALLAERIDGIERRSRKQMEMAL